MCELLNAYNSHVANKALGCLYSLALVSPTHRCEAYLSRNLTALHKNSSYFGGIFDIVEMAYPRVSAKSFLSDNIEISSALKTIKLENTTNQTSMSDLSTVAYVTNIYVDDLDLTKTPEENLSILLSNGKFKIEPNQHAKLFWAIRLKLKLFTPSGRLEILNILYKAAAVLLNCHPDRNVLFKFFHDKLELIKDFVWLLSTGPGTAELVSAHDLLLDLRKHACICLSATLESRDHTATPICANFPWLLHDLGVNRGQYMGLMPRLIRASSSFMASFGSKIDGKDCLFIDEERIAWIEQIFMLLSVLVNVTAALPSLTDNGLIPAILSLIKVDYDTSTLADSSFVNVLALEILETAFGHHSTTLTIFRESGGLDIIVNRLHLEVNRYLQLPQNSFPRIVFKQKLLIQVLIIILSAYVQESRNDINEDASQLSKNNKFSEVLAQIFSHAELFSTTIISSAISLISDLINRDPAPPTILTGMLANSSILPSCLAVLQRVESIGFELPNILLGLVSSISLVKDGCNLVTSSNAISQILALFHDEDNFYPRSKHLMTDLPTTMGGGFKQLIRHYPDYTELVVSGIVEEMNICCGRAENSMSYSFNSISDEVDYFIFNESFSKSINFCSAILSCLEQVLERKNTVEMFLGKGGFATLLRLRKVSLGPPRYLLSQLACLTDSSILSVGYTPLENQIIRCIQKLTAHEAKSVMDLSLSSLNQESIALKDSLCVYWNQRNVRCEDFSFSDLFIEFLETISSDPIQNYLEDGSITNNLILYTLVLRQLAMLDFSLEIFGLTLQSKNGRTINKECVANLQSEVVIKNLQNLLENIYIPLQSELARSRSTSRLNQDAPPVLVHPIYILRVTIENAVVRDNFEDYAKRVLKLSKGSVVKAYERKATSHNILKYRLEDGWISVQKNITNPESQVVVIDIEKKGEENIKMETEIATKALSDGAQKSDFERYTAVSARRAGILACVHFHYTVKSIIFGTISKLFYVKEQGIFHSIDAPSQIRDFADFMIPLYVNCVDLLLPVKNYESLPIDLSRIINEYDATAVSTWRNDQLFLSFFKSDEIPSIIDYNINSLIQTTKVIEICYQLLFDSKKARAHHDQNILLLIHLFYEKNILSRILTSSVHLFLAALNPFECNDRDGIERLCSGENFPGEWHSYLDHELEYGSLTVPTEMTGAFTKYKSLRLELRDRRRLGLMGLSSMLEFFRLLFGTFSSSVSSLDKILLNIADEQHDFNPEIFKRRGLMMLTSHLNQIWSHRLLRSLPPSVIRLVLDLMSTSAKSLQECKGFNLKTLKTEKQNKPNSTSMINPIVRRAARPPQFQVDEETVNALIEMGFERNDCVTAIRTLQSNDVPQLVTYLFDNPLPLPPLDNSTLDPAAEIDQIMSSMFGFPSSLAAAATLSSASKKEEENLNKIKLPSISTTTESEIRSETKFIAMLLVFILSSAPKVYLDLIESGPYSSPDLIDGELHNSNKNISREIFTVMMINQMLKIFEGYNLSDSNLRLIQLVWFYERAINFLKSANEVENFYFKLHGILHGIVLLMSSKVSNSPTYKTSTSEMLLFILRNDERFNILYELLISQLNTFLIEAKFEDRSSAWVSCALLILDITCQNIVFDIDYLKSMMKEIENMHKHNPGKLGDLSSFVGDPILSEGVKKLATEMFSQNSLGKQLSISDEEIDENTIKEFLRLSPLMESGLTTKQQLNCARLISQLLTLNSQQHFTISIDLQREIIRSCLQSIVHLQQDELVRIALNDSKIHLSILSINKRIDGIASTVFTIFQRQFEDVNSLKATMRLTMKTIFERISKQSNGIVSLKSFMELASPMLYRQQFAFLAVLSSKYEIKNIKGQICLINKELKKGVESQSTPAIEQKSESVYESGVPAKKMRVSEFKSIPVKFESIEPQNKRKNSHDLSNRNAKNLIVSEIVQEMAKQVIRLIGIAKVNDVQESIQPFLKVEDLLYTLADLIVAIPQFGLYISKYKLLDIPLLEIQMKKTSHRHNSGHSFLSFLLDYLIFEDFKFGEVTSETDRNQSVLGSNVLDSCAYFFASMLSRPGESRSIARDELAQALVLDETEVANSEVLDSYTKLVECVQSLINPPLSWLQRDSFVVPVKDIIFDMIDNGYHKIVAGAFTKIDVSDGINSNKFIVLSILLESLLRRYHSLQKSSIDQTVIKFPENRPLESASSSNDGVTSATNISSSSSHPQVAQEYNLSQNTAVDSSILGHEHLLMPAGAQTVDFGEDSSDEDGQEMADIDEDPNESDLDPTNREEEDDDDEDDDIDPDELEELEEVDENSDENSEAEHHQHSEDDDEDGEDEDEDEDVHEAEDDHSHVDMEVIDHEGDENDSNDDSHDDDDDEDGENEENENEFEDQDMNAAAEGMYCAYFLLIHK